MDDKYRQAMRDDPKLAKYLNEFNEEFVNASFKKGKKHLHKSKELKRDSYNRNNARNRCIYTREKAQGALNYIEDVKTSITEEFQEYEDELIDAIDYNLSLNKVNNSNDGSNESN